MNFKSFITLLLIFGLNTISTAQCPTTDILLNSQASIDSFSINYPGCTTIPSWVDMTIDDSISGTITNLDGLNQLTTIGRSLFIEDNSNLKNLYGLNQLTSIGLALDIKNNPSLTNVDDLSQMLSINSYLNIQNNDALINVDGLNQLTFVGSYLMIKGNNSLMNLDGLSQVAFVGEHLWIDANFSLTNVDGLSQITSVGRDIYISGNSVLTNVDGLSQITSVGNNLTILFNPYLTNLDGLNQITSIEGDIQIEYNSLSQCCALCPLLAADATYPAVIGGTITIGNNLTGCNSEAEINACNPCTTCAVDLTLNTTEAGSINYTVSNSIISTDNIIGIENVLYDAGNIIELQSGFSAADSCNFSAVIGGCQ